ncbi:MAG TPA: adenosylcobalamin-dependent ribonucleoside-diphosphate reductase [Caulobacteraceae bacterium]|nr:adenosylcobalamin-dependent ribonucleoside-diphosphate reductase [Caulobacteraceae bacterium]
MAFDIPLAEEIWSSKYRFKPADEAARADASIEETWSRVADAIALAEPAELRQQWAGRFRQALTDFRFLPAGRILAGAGAGRRVTLFNCFVMGAIPDDLSGIFEHVREAAVTLQQGGGVGMDFSTIRPAGAPVRGVAAHASGPLSFMEVWDCMCRTILSAGQRRGAMMGCLAIDHPDIEAFIDAKRDPAKFRNFNLSVLVPDRFLAALETGDDWRLVFQGQLARTVPARALWDRLMRAAYDSAEPGVIFIDRVNETNNLAWCETICASNPCGEQMLPPYGACLLGSINLARLIHAPFTSEAAIDEAELADLTATAVRFLDDVIDVSGYPLPQQETEAKAKRRIGLGVTGLADALIFCGARHGEDEAVDLAAGWLSIIRRAAYRASAAIAAEKGPFPLYDAAILDRPNLKSLDETTRSLIAEHGLRNGCLTSIAPTGTTSLLAGNVSSGIEPVFAYEYTRKIRQEDCSTREEPVEDYALTVWRRLHGDEPPPEAAFVTAQTLRPEHHLRMQAAAQALIDSSISKTINCPEDIPFEAFADIYLEGWRRGCKGLTVYRPNLVTGSVLSVTAKQPAHPPLTPRPERLAGATYKLKWPQSAHAVYVTINDEDFGGDRRPFEIFVNSKNMEHYAWTLGLTRMISAVFRRGGDVSFVAEELKAVFDPRGGAWMEGRYVPSLQAAIGAVIERHLGAVAEPTASAGPEPVGRPPAAACPRCGSLALVRQEGCDVCADCGYSKCS